jgi:PEGA domain
MMHPRRFLGIVLSLAVVNVGCGAMFNESTKLVPVYVTPAGARISVDGLYVAQAPGSVELTSAESHSIDIEANGYEKQHTNIESRTSAGYVVLDCVLLVFFVVPGVIALVVDGATGDWKVLDTDRLSVQLNPSQPPQRRWVTPAAVPAAPGGCQYDAQCKGDRICRAGQCVAPTEPDEGTTVPPDTAAPKTPDSPTAPPSKGWADPFVH